MAVGNRIKEKYSKNDWDKDLVVVTQVIYAEGTTIIISNGSNSQIELSAKGSVREGDVNLADVNADLKVIHESNIATRFVAKPELTPLFLACGLRRKHIIGPPQEFKPVWKKPDLDFVAVDYSDYPDTK